MLPLSRSVSKPWKTVSEILKVAKCEHFVVLAVCSKRRGISTSNENVLNVKKKSTFCQYFFKLFLKTSWQLFSPFSKKQVPSDRHWQGSYEQTKKSCKRTEAVSFVFSLFSWNKQNYKKKTARSATYKSRFLFRVWSA